MSPLPTKDIGYTGAKEGENFFSKEEELSLLEFAKTAAFEPGRQKTGYLKYRVKPHEFVELQARSREQLGIDESIPNDCYLLKYPQGSSIPTHRDTIDAEHEHWRLNVVLQSEFTGGDCLFEYQVHPMRPGSFVVFRPDSTKHQVKPILSGERLVWSFGCSKPAKIPTVGALCRCLFSFHAQQWNGNERAGFLLNEGDWAVFTGEYGVSKRSHTLRVRILTRFGPCWAGAHYIDPV